MPIVVEKCIRYAVCTMRRYGRRGELVLFDILLQNKNVSECKALPEKVKLNIKLALFIYIYFI